MPNTAQSLGKVNRLEIIDHTKPAEEGGGRVFVKRDDNFTLGMDIQDDGRTLKIFLGPKGDGLSIFAN